jgi:hypothetical protein
LSLVNVQQLTKLSGPVARLGRCNEPSGVEVVALAEELKGAVVARVEMVSHR